MRKRHPAVYRISSKVTGWFYIGASVNYKNRWTSHKSVLRKGEHCCKQMQCDFNDHGLHSFQFEVLEYVDAIDLAAREQHWLDKTKDATNRYNTCLFVGSRKGIACSSEHKARISAGLTGGTCTEAARENLRNGAKNRPPVSSKTRALQSLARTGLVRSEETKRKISEAMTMSHAARRAMLEGVSE